MRNDVDESRPGERSRDNRLQGGSHRCDTTVRFVSPKFTDGGYAVNVNSAARIKVQKPRPRTNKNALKKGVPIKVSPRTLSGLTRVFKQLADESRLKILLALAEEGEMHVSALCDLLNQTQPAVSHHLTLLRMTGLVGFRRAGKHNFYRVDSSFLSDLLEQFFGDVGSGPSLQFRDFSLAYKRSRR